MMGSMQQIRWALLVVLFGSIVAAHAAPSSKTPASIYRDNIGGIFTIHTPDSTGTGFAFGVGRIATNAHVVGGSSLVDVEAQDGAQFKAKVVAKDADRDF